MWELYDELIRPIPDTLQPARLFQNEYITLAQFGSHAGGTITNNIDTIEPVIADGNYDSLSWKETASLIKSWNLKEASLGAAAINAFYNQDGKIRQHIDSRQDLQIGQEQNPFAALSSRFDGKKIATIGHFCFAEPYIQNTTAETHIIELYPEKGDYPLSACECFLPEMDYVMITGYTLINKTLPRLLELAKNAYVVLVGCSVPMAPALFDFGLRELDGSVLTEFEKTRFFAEETGHVAMLKTGQRLRFMKKYDA